MFNSDPLQRLKERENKLLILLVILISTSFFMSRIYEPSLSPDEAKYALIAKNMLSTKNFLIPDLTIKLYFKKPPFFFWLIAASIKLFGTNEFAVRFPSALFSIMDSVLIYILVRRITENKLAAFLSSMVFVINFEVIRICSIARFESFILFVNLITILLLTYPNFKRTVLSGLILGAGLLTKGPFAIPGAVSTVMLHTFKRNSKNIYLTIISLLIGVSIFSIFLLTMWKTHPEFFKEFFGKQILGRLTGTLKEGMPKPVYFYERIILKHFWIWNLFLFYGIFLLLKNGIKAFPVKNKDLFISFFTFFLIIFASLHFISLKFTRYSYYLYPFLSLLVSLVIIRKETFKKLAISYIALVSCIYFLSASICPCSFHRDKMRDIRLLTEIGVSNYGNLGISKAIDIYTAYALLFKFPLEMKNPKYLISKEPFCENKILKYKKYCIIKVEDESAASNNSYWMERRN